MKLTKKQKNDLFNCHIGVGEIIFKNADNEIKQFEFYVSKNNEIKNLFGTICKTQNLNEFVLKNCNFTNEI